MQHSPDTTAALTIALALAAGMIAQALARHLRLPGIVLLLAAGVLLGPDVLGIIDPDSLGPALHALVGFAVAVILFEGGLNLNLKRLRREAGVIRRLLTIGVLVTALGAAVSARLFMGWDWGMAAAFGILVIVTGPTVVTPILRRIKIKHAVATVLEAEGVLIDAIGAVLAVVMLQVIIGTSIAEGLLSIVARLGLGLVLGLAGGLLIALLLRVPHVVPEGLENVFTLSLVLALFHLSNSVLAESGIMSVTAAGMVVGNMRTHVQRDLMEFKEQITVMLIGLLFVLLAADVRLAEVTALGWPAVVTVASLMFLVRPLNVALCAYGSTLSMRERAFLSWLAPRGVVAAAVATLFAQAFAASGIPGGKELQALVFLVIAATVTVQGLSAGSVASALHLRRPEHEGCAILGANELGHTVGRLLRMAGEEVTFLDSNPTTCKIVEEDGFKVVFGSVLHERTLQRARLEDRAACIGATTNDEVNLLFARSAAEEFKVPRITVAVSRDQTAVTPAVVHNNGAGVLFGVPRDLEVWSVRLRRGLAEIESWKLEVKPSKPEDVEQAQAPFDFPRGILLPLVVQRGTDARAVGSERQPRKGDLIHFAVFSEHLDEGHAWLVERGWQFVEPLDRDVPVSGVKSVEANES